MYFWACSCNNKRATELSIGKPKIWLSFGYQVQDKSILMMFKAAKESCSPAVGCFYKIHILVTSLGLNKLPSVCHKLRLRSAVPKTEVEWIWIYNPAQLHLLQEVPLKEDFLLHGISSITKQQVKRISEQSNSLQLPESRSSESFICFCQNNPDAVEMLMLLTVLFPNWIDCEYSNSPQEFSDRTRPRVCRQLSMIWGSSFPGAVKRQIAVFVTK